ncbi:hypothetical protein [Bacillus sp. JJ722]
MSVTAFQRRRREIAKSEAKEVEQNQSKKARPKIEKATQKK